MSFFPFFTIPSFIFGPAVVMHLVSPECHFDPRTSCPPLFHHVFFFVFPSGCAYLPFTSDGLSPNPSPPSSHFFLSAFYPDMVVPPEAVLPLIQLRSLVWAPIYYIFCLSLIVGFFRFFLSIIPFYAFGSFRCGRYQRRTFSV